MHRFAPGGGRWSCMGIWPLSEKARHHVDSPKAIATSTNYSPPFPSRNPRAAIVSVGGLESDKSLSRTLHRYLGNIPRLCSAVNLRGRSDRWRSCGTIPRANSIRPVMLLDDFRIVVNPVWGEYVLRSEGIEGRGYERHYELSLHGRSMRKLGVFSLQTSGWFVASGFL